MTSMTTDCNRIYRQLDSPGRGRDSTLNTASKGMKVRIVDFPKRQTKFGGLVIM